MSMQSIIGLVVSLLLTIFGRQTWAQELAAFLSQLSAAMNGGTGTIPAVKLGATWFGPIPYGPNPQA